MAVYYIFAYCWLNNIIAVSSMANIIRNYSDIHLLSGNSVASLSCKVEFFKVSYELSDI